MFPLLHRAIEHVLAVEWDLDPDPFIESIRTFEPGTLLPTYFDISSLSAIEWHLDPDPFIESVRAFELGSLLPTHFDISSVLVSTLKSVVGFIPALSFLLGFFDIDSPIPTRTTLVQHDSGLAIYGLIVCMVIAVLSPVFILNSRLVSQPSAVPPGYPSYTSRRSIDPLAYRRFVLASLPNINTTSSADGRYGKSSYSYTSYPSDIASVSHVDIAHGNRSYFARSAILQPTCHRSNIASAFNIDTAFSVGGEPDWSEIRKERSREGVESSSV